MNQSFYSDLIEIVKKNDCQDLRKRLENANKEDIIASLCKINFGYQREENLTILHVAAYYDSFESFLLIEDILKLKGMDEHQILSTLSANSYYPLHYALINGSFEVSEYILAKIPQQASEVKGINMNSIELAVTSKEPELLEDVLKAIGDLNSDKVKEQINIAIQKASKNGAYSCLVILIEQNAYTRQPQGQSSMNDNILLKALVSKSPEAISLIMKHHKNELTQTFKRTRNKKNVDICFLSELFTAAKGIISLRPVIKEALKILKDKDIDITPAENPGAVHWICITGDIDIAKYVLDNFMVNVNKLDENGETGAHHLIYDKCKEDNVIEFIKLLLDKGFNPNVILMKDGSIKAQTLLQKCIMYTYLNEELLKATEFLLSSCNCNPDALMYLPSRPNNRITIREYVNEHRSDEMQELFARIPIQS